MNDLSPPFKKPSMEDLSHKASLALKAGKLAAFEWDLVTDICVADAMLLHVFGLPEGEITGAMVLDRVLPEDRDALNAEIQRTLTENVDYDTCFRVGTPDNFTWIGGRGRVVKWGDNGAPLRMMGVNWNMNETKRSEERQRALTREMDHRVNNGYAIIKAITAIAVDEYDSVPEFAKMLRTQIHALAVAHQLAADFLLHEHVNTRALSMTKVVKNSMRQVALDRLNVDISPGLAIMPQSAASVSMLLHHFCMQARTDAPIDVQLRPAPGGMAELTWISGDGAFLRDVSTRVDFLVSLCAEQLDGTIQHYANSTEGQNIVLALPVLNTHCSVEAGQCPEGESCLLHQCCGYSKARDGTA